MTPKTKTAQRENELAERDKKISDYKRLTIDELLFLDRLFAKVSGDHDDE